MARWDADRTALLALAPTLERLIVEDSDEGVRAKAVRARGALDYDGRTRPPALPSATIALIDFLASRYEVEQSPAVRSALVDVIGGTANESQRRGPTILRALSDASAPARRAAARQAANIIDPSALPRLVELLHDADMTVRLTAATTIGRFGGLAKTYLPQLQEALAREPDGTTQRVIEGAIKTISR